MLAGITTILLMGTLWLSFYLRIPVSRAFLAGFLPFLPFDIIKAFIAGTLAGSILRSSRETR
jgi:biotin transport system substrate-specific component